MPDNWGFVAAAYALAAIVLGAYWRMLVRKERELTALRTRPGRGTTGTPNGKTGVSSTKAGALQP
jgi:hypothetical protein